MFLDHILRPSEIKEFASELQDHQMAQLAVDNKITVDDEDLDEKGNLKGRKGAGNVLDKAVMEHNIQACAKVRTRLLPSSTAETQWTDGIGTRRSTIISHLMDWVRCWI